VLSLLLFIGAFAGMAVESPQPGIELHRARMSDDEQHRELLEQRLVRRQLQRKLFIGSLLGMAVIVAAVGFI